MHRNCSINFIRRNAIDVRTSKNLISFYVNLGEIWCHDTNAKHFISRIDYENRQNHVQCQYKEMSKYFISIQDEIFKDGYRIQSKLSGQFPQVEVEVQV